MNRSVEKDALESAALLLEGLEDVLYAYSYIFIDDMVKAANTLLEKHPFYDQLKSESIIGLTTN